VDDRLESSRHQKEVARSHDPRTVPLVLSLTAPTELAPRISVDELEAAVLRHLGGASASSGVPHRSADVDEMLVRGAQLLATELGLLARFGSQILDLDEAAQWVHADAIALGVRADAVGVGGVLAAIVRSGDHEALGRTIADAKASFTASELVEAVAALVASTALIVGDLIDVPALEVHAEVSASVPALRIDGPGPSAPAGGVLGASGPLTSPNPFQPF
jgi:hypothetical protein